ncbi:hypothetical protein DOY81_003940, partial [Sarcophaga bullata]
KIQKIKKKISTKKSTNCCPVALLLLYNYQYHLQKGKNVIKKTCKLLSIAMAAAARQQQSAPPSPPPPPPLQAKMIRILKL